MKSTFTILVIICFVCCFYVAGYMFYSTFYNLVMPAIDGIQYQMELDQIEHDQDIFSLLCALIPFSIYFTWEMIPLFSGDKKALTVFIILICIALAVYIRYKMLISQFNELLQSLSDRSMAISFLFEQLDYEWYFAGGLWGGCIISYLSFRNKVTQRRNFGNSRY